jgi:hypothetical protein
MPEGLLVRVSSILATTIAATDDTVSATQKVNIGHNESPRWPQGCQYRPQMGNTRETPQFQKLNAKKDVTRCQDDYLADELYGNVNQFFIQVIY